jgi:hypothetical protein
MAAHATVGRRTSARRWAALVALLATAVATQVALEGRAVPRPAVSTVTWIQSPAVMRRLTFGFNTVWADVYWIRAIQFFGGTKLSKDPHKDYRALYPLLDITTGLDPHFNIAYRLGAILLSEDYPSGAGNTDQALALLEKGMREMPGKWQYLQDAGFVNYWWRHDYQAAAQWFLKADAIPGAPKWLGLVAAATLAERGQTDVVRELWSRMAENAEHEWLRQAARRGLKQLDALNTIEILLRVVNTFYDDHHRFPASWQELVASGRLRAEPHDPAGWVYTLNPDSGEVDVATKSPLFPLPGRRVP